MIPGSDFFESYDNISQAADSNIPTLTYKMNKEESGIAGNVDGLSAIEQAIYKILQTQRYQNQIYSGNYGIELDDLYGQHISYVCPELERRITEALLWDSRIEKVDSFKFDTSKKGIITVSFNAATIFGEVKTEREVTV